VAASNLETIETLQPSSRSSSGWGLTPEVPDIAEGLSVVTLLFADPFPEGGPSTSHAAPFHVGSCSPCGTVVGREAAVGLTGAAGVGAEAP
jgi:hypothetical protein